MRLAVNTTGIRRFELLALITGAVFWLSACSNVQIDRTPSDRFEAANYKTYTWRTLPIENTYGSDDPLYVVGPALRDAVDANLRKKGYLSVPEGGDFIIDFALKASLTDGALASGATNIDPIPSTVINRMPDGATVDNAYALSGVRQVNSLLIRFEDGEDQALIWAASMSRVVEDRNMPDEKIIENVSGAVEQALRPLPPTPERR